MEPEKINNFSNNFRNVIKVQKIIEETFCDGANVTQSVLQLDELFKFFDEHFNEFHQKEDLPVMLAFIHRCIKLWISRGDYLKDDIGILLINFIKQHREDENDLNIVVIIVYQIMSSIKYFGNNDVSISKNLFCELNTIVASIKCRTLISRCLACIQLYMEMFPQSSENLTSLWSNIQSKLESDLKLGIIQDTEIDILIQLIDDFKAIKSNLHEDPIVVGIIQHLLKSDQRKSRKCGYFLLKKIFRSFIENGIPFAAMWISSDHKEQIERSWIMYITILENLEEEQSHLILPSLENLEKLIKSKYLNSSWLDILYIRILTHNNNLVMRWSIEFFLKTFTCSDLGADILKHLLQATNSNLIYNYEGYFLNAPLITLFLNGNLINLLTLLPEIKNWKSVPLYVWLENLKEKELPKSTNLEMILKICACVRKLQNYTIRQNTIKMCHELFDDFVKKMSMAEYVTYVETLYNSSDKYSDHEMFFNKKSSFIDSKPKSSIFEERFYEIFTNYEWDNNELLLFLKDIPVKLHGWLKFALFNLELSECNQNHIKNLYSIALNSLTYCDLDEVINTFKNGLLDSPPYDKHQLGECQRAAISFYIYKKVNFKNEAEYTQRFILNSEIKHRALDTFVYRFLDGSNKMIDMWFIDELLKYNNNDLLELVSYFLVRNYDEDIVYKYAVKILEKYKYISVHFFKFNFLKHCTDELFKVLASKGETRIEQAFCFYHFNAEISDLFKFTLNLINRFSDEQFVLDLLKYHTDLTQKKPRYFENSTEHRIKLRIAICIYTAFCKKKYSVDVLDQIWNIVLNENNQLNIIYTYEYILGSFERRTDFMLNKLKEASSKIFTIEGAQSLTSSQQVSVISVVFKYSLSRLADIETRKTVVSNLLALTMGANFQTRLFAQMSLYILLKRNNFSKGIEGSQQIIQSIEYATGTKLDEYLNDIRMCTFSKHTLHIILYVTNTPFDELFELFDLSDTDKLLAEDIAQVKLCRDTFMKKIKVTTNEEDTLPKNSINNQIQRKINPVNDLNEPHNLIIYPTEEKTAQMFVIASLIDKLPNLGGIARTCEVLGIQNLVMDSKMHTSKNDFKNLSMTAEKTLNIVEVKPKDLKEFIINKRLQGYAIVGAEQTCNSQNFSNFKFPQKCILLLGHEKDGIPAPLLGLLDYAVEIPQFGQIRSLNVHVTGALFMWEFCKQHLVQEQ